MIDSAEELLELAAHARKLGHGRPPAAVVDPPVPLQSRVTVAGPKLERRCCLCGRPYFGPWVAVHLALGRCT